MTKAYANARRCLFNMSRRFHRLYVSSAKLAYRMERFKQYISDFNAMKTLIMIVYIMTPYSQVGGAGIRHNNVLLISSTLKRR